jgi:hypothetical protein
MLFPAVFLMGERPETDLFYGASASCWSSRLVAVHPAGLRTKLRTKLGRKGIVPVYDWLTAAAAARFCISSKETSSLCVAIVH